MSHTCIEPRRDRELELALFAGGDLGPDESAPVEAHLAACPACRELVAGLRESHAGVAALAGEPMDPAALARIRQAVRRRILEEGARETRRPAWALALAAGLVLAVIAAAVWLRAGAPDAGPTPAPAERVAELPGAPADPPAPPPESPAETEEGRTPAATSSPLPPIPPVPPAPPAPPARRAAAPDPPTRRAAAEPMARPAPPSATEPMVIQVVSNDPDIVFYWLVEPEETEDEALSS